MKGFPTWQEYQVEQNATLLSKEECLLLKQQYQRLYFREYNQRRKQKKLSLNLTQKEYRVFVQVQKEYTGYSLNRIIINMAFAYINHEYVVPDPIRQQALIGAINKIGNLINQVIHKLQSSSLRINKMGIINLHTQSLLQLLDAYEQIKKQLAQLTLIINDYTSRPPLNILAWSWEEVRYDVQKLDMLLEFLMKQREILSKRHQP